MAYNKKSLLSELEQDVLDERPLAATLRKLILFGGQAGSPELRDWASKELRGYGSSDEVPSYRTVPAIIQMDGSTRFAIVTGQRLGVSELPDFAQKDIDEEFSFRGPISEIEQMSTPRTADDTFVKLSLPMARELGRVMARDQGGRIHIDSIYWAISRVSIAKVADQVRTRLAELLGELRSVTPSGQSLPSPAQTQQAVNIVFKGFSRPTINTINAGANSTNNIENPREAPASFWTLGRRIGAAIGGAVALVAGLVAIIQFLR